MDISSINSNLANYINTSTKETQESNAFQTLLDAAVEKKDQAGLKKACQDFEGYYLQQMFSEMRKTIPDGGLIESSQGKEIYEDMLYEEYAKNISTGKGVGLADMLYKQLSKKI